ncbi:glycoside hydrolase family 47 protein [Coniochaeta sp. 2T2.1]|nr:glycoside hydrolase family 47 protein [Coniochaeta sp. 2T2.1]
MVSARRSRLALIIFILSATASFLFVRFRLAASPSPSAPPASFTKPAVQFQKSSIDWILYPTYFPIRSLTKLPRGRPTQLPRIQHDFKGAKQWQAAERALAVRKVFARSWKAYKEKAWLHDELKPLSGGYDDNAGGWAATVVESLDTLWIMGLYSEFYEAVAAAVAIDFGNRTSIDVPEATTRHLGGLLAAYDLSGEPALLQKARELGDLLYLAFDTPNRMPSSVLELRDARFGRQRAGTDAPKTGVGRLASLSLEFTRLAQLTGDDFYYDAVARVAEVLQRAQARSTLPGVWPVRMDFRQEDGAAVEKSEWFAVSPLYETLAKMYLLLGGRRGAEHHKTMYRRAIDVVARHLLFRPMLPGGEDVLFTGIAHAGDDGVVTLLPDVQHWNCFLGGVVALGAKLFDEPEHALTSERLTRGCAWAYGSTTTGLTPESFALLKCPSLEPCPWDEELWQRRGNNSSPKGITRVVVPRYRLKPETIESLFVLYRTTGQEDLPDIAWSLFNAVAKATETEFGHATVKNATGDFLEWEDSMDSFWMSETLKYFYLMFSPPDHISLDDYVFSTRAHPFRRT